MNSREAVWRLAQFAVETQLSDLSDEVLYHTRQVLLDTVGVILAGSTASEVRALAQRLARPQGGPSTILGNSLKASPLNATLVNGTAATWLDFDSGHRHPPGLPLLPAGHPAVHMIPPALAVAEALGSSGADLAVAMVIGYDIGARVGISCRVRGEIHPHGTFPNICAAAAVARLMGAGVGRMEQTIQMAANLTLLPSFENAYQGCTVRNTYSGVGGMAGILAAQLAKAGFTAEEDAVGTVFGRISSDWMDPNLMVEALGERYEITQGYIKPYPSCRYSHPAIEAARGLVERNQQLSPEEIETVEVHSYDLAATLGEKAPATGLAAKFSIPYAVASMLVRHTASPQDFCDEAVQDPAVRAVAAHVQLFEDPRYTAQVPANRPARVVVRSRNGDSYCWEVERTPGGPDAPMSVEQINAKFHLLADPVLGADRTRAVREMIGSVQAVAQVRSLTRLLKA